ncbi:RsmB/NOP family class I SAM-dependent RNA methyltransferase [Lactobacillus sp. Sy-1]|uniref:RsmB/NOP family class I SAM-dependent RNA methyltransferase n=1 Tax=Lactobacillus sp. Sy-1 TaxID=2109645 RepID=UPI00351D8CEA
MLKLPEQFKLKYEKLLGDQAEAFFQSFEQPVNHAFRINPLKQHLPNEESLSDPVPHCQWGYYGKVNGKSVDHQSGAVYSQEPSAMYVGEVAAPKPGMKVLDLCAAPGGKSTHLASFLDNTGLLVSNEINYKRAKILVENLERFGAQNTVILNEDPQTLRKHFPAYFDQILVDAPCSGEGMFHKDPDATQYWNSDYPSECAVRQQAILSDAVQMLKPGGELVYSTCTFAPEEDEQIIAWLLTKYPFEMVPINKDAGMVDAKPEWADGNPEIAKAVRLFPHLFRGEGHFIAKLRLKEAVNNPKPIKKFERGNLNREQKQLWADFMADNIDQLPINDLICFGDQLYTLQANIPELKGLKVMRPGLLFGTFKKKRFEPSYALALAVQPASMKKTVVIDHAQWAKYVHGDTFKLVDDAQLTKGWYQLICDDQAIGFGKNVNGTIKNFFPKGLRFAAK